MSPEFDDLVARAVGARLKVGPIALRPNGHWRAYVQTPEGALWCGERPRLEDALADALKLAGVGERSSLLD